MDDTFTVTVKAAPVVASILTDMTGLEAGATQEVSLTGVFDDPDNDALTITATSSDTTVATTSVSSDGSTLTVAGVAEGTATITVTAQDSDGNRVSEAFDVPVARKYAGLIAQMYEWRNNNPEWSSYKEHTDRWDRALLAFGETVADTSLTPMTAAEAQGYADRGWTRWVEVAAALRLDARVLLRRSRRRLLVLVGVEQIERTTGRKPLLPALRHSSMHRPHPPIPAQPVHPPNAPRFRPRDQSQVGNSAQRRQLRHAEQTPLFAARR